MKTYSERFNKYFQQNKHMLFCCMLYTFIIGLIAHGYMYFQGTFTHDSLNEFNAAIFGNFWKLQLGRFLVPVYRFFISGDILLPYFSGLLSLLWISLAVFVVVKLFNIQSKKIVALICGIFTVNTTVIALNATFMHDLDADLFALFLSVCATYFWNKNSIKYNILSVIGIVLVLGIYQAYISTTITLMIICLLLSLLKNDDFRSIYKKGLQAIIILLLGMFIYFVVNTLLKLVLNIEAAQGYNSLNQMNLLNLSGLIWNLLLSHYNILQNFFFSKSALPQPIVFTLSLSLISLAGYIIFIKFLDNRVEKRNKLLIIFFILIMPTGMSVAQILSGVCHDLMNYALCLVYLLVILIMCNLEQFQLVKQNWLLKHAKIICSVLIFVILFGNIRLANQLYLKKDLEQDSIVALYTRVWDKIQSFDGYDRETTPVVFVGKPEQYSKPMSGFEKSHKVTGGDVNYGMSSLDQNRYHSLFQYRFHYDILTGKEEDVEQMLDNEIVKEMPSFPKDGSIKLIDEILVVKMGEIKSN